MWLIHEFSKILNAKELHLAQPIFKMNQILPIAAKRESRIEKFNNYLQVGYLLHSIGFASIIISGLILQITLNTFSTDQPLPFVFFTWLSSFFFMNALFSQLDAFSRYQNFKKTRDQLHAYGFQKRIVKPLAKSNCQRLAAVIAARQIGVERETRRFYYDLGYRWYHVLPDFVNANPLFIFHPFFWKSTFFVKRYRSVYF
jgi:hypothetical protein